MQPAKHRWGGWGGRSPPHYRTEQEQRRTSGVPPNIAGGLGGAQPPPVIDLNKTKNAGLRQTEAGGFGGGAQLRQTEAGGQPANWLSESRGRGMGIRGLGFEIRDSGFGIRHWVPGSSRARNWDLGFGNSGFGIRDWVPGSSTARSLELKNNEERRAPSNIGGGPP